jgi:hypothetical protein
MARIASFVGRAGLVGVLGLAMLTGAGSVQANSRPKERDRHKDCDEKQVLVINEDDEPVPVRVVGRDPFQAFQRPFSLDWPDGEGFATSGYTVPAGRRLVIEYASLFAYLQTEGQTMFVRILTTAGGGSAFHTLAVQKQEDYGVLKQFGAAHVVRIYADPGSTVQVSAGRLPFNGTANGTVTLSGHFENVP